MKVLALFSLGHTPSRAYTAYAAAAAAWSLFRRVPESTTIVPIRFCSSAAEWERLSHDRRSRGEATVDTEGKGSAKFPGAVRPPRHTRLVTLFRDQCL